MSMVNEAEAIQDARYGTPAGAGAAQPPDNAKMGASGYSGAPVAATAPSRWVVEGRVVVLEIALAAKESYIAVLKAERSDILNERNAAIRERDAAVQRAIDARDAAVRQRDLAVDAFDAEHARAEGLATRLGVAEIGLHYSSVRAQNAWCAMHDWKRMGSGVDPLWECRSCGWVADAEEREESDRQFEEDLAWGTVPTRHMDRAAEITPDGIDRLLRAVFPARYGDIASHTLARRSRAEALGRLGIVRRLWWWLIGQGEV